MGGFSENMALVWELNYYYYLFTAIWFAPGGSGPYTTQLQQKTYSKNKYTP
jgi:hypothetical protein